MSINYSPGILLLLKTLTTEEKMRLCLIADTSDEAAVNNLSAFMLEELVRDYEWVKVGVANDLNT